MLPFTVSNTKYNRFLLCLDSKKNSGVTIPSTHLKHLHKIVLPGSSRIHLVSKLEILTELL